MKNYYKLKGIIYQKDENVLNNIPVIKSPLKNIWKLLKKFVLSGKDLNFQDIEYRFIPMLKSRIYEELLGLPSNIKFSVGLCVPKNKKKELYYIGYFLFITSPLNELELLKLKFILNILYEDLDNSYCKIVIFYLTTPEKENEEERDKIISSNGLILASLWVNLRGNKTLLEIPLLKIYPIKSIFNYIFQIPTTYKGNYLLHFKERKKKIKLYKKKNSQSVILEEKGLFFFNFIKKNLGEIFYPVDIKWSRGGNWIYRLVYFPYVSKIQGTIEEIISLDVLLFILNSFEVKEEKEDKSVNRSKLNNIARHFIYYFIRALKILKSFIYFILPFKKILKKIYVSVLIRVSLKIEKIKENLKKNKIFSKDFKVVEERKRVKLLKKHLKIIKKRQRNFSILLSSIVPKYKFFTFIGFYLTTLSFVFNNTLENILLFFSLALLPLIIYHIYIIYISHKFINDYKDKVISRFIQAWFREFSIKIERDNRSLEERINNLELTFEEKLKEINKYKEEIDKKLKSQTIEDLINSERVRQHIYNKVMEYTGDRIKELEEKNERNIINLSSGLESRISNINSEIGKIYGKLLEVLSNNLDGKGSAPIITPMPFLSSIQNMGSPFQNSNNNFLKDEKIEKSEPKDTVKVNSAKDISRFGQKIEILGENLDKVKEVIIKNNNKWTSCEEIQEKEYGRALAIFKPIRPPGEKILKIKWDDGDTEIKVRIKGLKG